VNGKRVNTQASDILITKILLGTLGCVPAYDEYLKLGARQNGIVLSQLTTRSVIACCDFYERHEAHFKSVSESLRERGLDFPPMKLLDTYFWEVGYRLKTV
jgi:hypothetical protein